MLFLLSRTSYWCPHFIFAMKLASMVPEVGKNRSDDVTSSLLPLALASSSSSGITSAQGDVMTSDASSGGLTTFPGEGEASVSSFITFLILLGGVVGGLVLVVLVLLVCKYCVKAKRIGRRSLRDASREPGRPIRVMQRYETINSETLSSDPASASIDGIPLSPRKFLDFRTRSRTRDENEEANERTYLRTSYEKDLLYDHQKDGGSFRSLAASASGSPGSRKSADHLTHKDETEADTTTGGHRSPSNSKPAESGGGGGGVGSRRVSFQLEGKLSRQDSEDSRNNRRYTEGDFHYLKYAKITALPRQFSLGPPSPSLGATAPSSAPLPARTLPSLGATASDTAFRYSLDERLRMLQEDTEKSFPPIQPADSSGRTSASPQRSPRPRSGSRASSQEGTLSVNSGGLEIGGGGVSKMRLSPSPPRFPQQQQQQQRSGSGGSGGGGSGGGEQRWRRTPSASPSPPGEPVHRQINAEVHYQQGSEGQGLSPNTLHEPVSPRYNASIKHEMMMKHHSLPSTLQDSPSSSSSPSSKKQHHPFLHETARKHFASSSSSSFSRDNAFPKHHSGGKSSSSQEISSKHYKTPPLSHENSRHDISRHENARHENFRHEPSRHENSRHENSRHENFRHENSRLDGPRKQHSVSSAQDMPKKHLPQKQVPPKLAVLKQQQQQQQQHLPRPGSGKHEAAILARPVPKHLQRSHAYQQKQVTSHSLELAEARRGRAKATRKVKSYEDVADYDVLQITEFSRGPFYNTDYDVISELASPTSSKVRYNDTGSLEELQEEVSGEVSCLALEALLPPNDTNSDDTATLNGSHQNREIWHLRATLEEEEECSDTVRMEDGTSPDDSPDRDHVQTTSFESTVPSDACTSDQRDSGIQWEGRMQELGNRGPHPAARDDPHPHHPHHPNGNGGGGVAQLLHPNYENRRQTYRNILSSRLARSPAGPGVAAILSSASADNSFDSVETDGDVSDTSRHEVTTTSFESTTDNTDSTTESQHSRLMQMKTDSGYKSLETQQSGVREAMEAQVEHHEERVPERIELRGEAGGDGRRGGAQQQQQHAGASGSGAGHNNAASGEVAGGRRNSNAMHFERRAGRTASKKRREYSRDRQAIHVYESVQEPETDSIRSDVPSGDSFDDSSQQRRYSHAMNHQQHHHFSLPQPPSSKRSIFTRFFSYGHGRDKYMVRDYSIDEKTNQIFNEFLRQEIPDDNFGGGRDGNGGCSNGRLGLRRSPRPQHRPRLQRKHTEPLYRFDDRRRDRLAPEMRSASLGSDSSASSVRRLSPQDSIEEEYEEEGEAEKNWRRTELAPMMEVADTDCLDRDIKSAMLCSASKAVHDIPVIKLPEGEVPNPS